MTLRELRKNTGLRVYFVWCCNAGSAFFVRLPSRRPGSRQSHCYEARLIHEDESGRHSGYLFTIGSHGGMYETIAGGWTQKEARKNLVNQLRGKKVVSIHGPWHKTVTRIPKTLTA